jgi:hypothetical protein
MNTSMTGPAQILHLVGFVTGAVLYAMLLGMVTRRSPADRLAVATALLGCAWNIGELTAWALRNIGFAHLASWTDAASYAALGFLGFVVVHSVARMAIDAGVRGALVVWRVVVVLGYGGASVAAAMHVASVLRGAAPPSPTGLLVITVALATSVVPVILTSRGDTRSRRVLWMAALALFAVSALHLRQLHVGTEGWVSELAGHHASLLLAFAVLYQDYRFALADLFLKQALTLLAVVILVVGAWSIVAASADGGASGSLDVGVLLALWVVTALVVPAVRRGVVLFVDRVVLKRGNYRALLDRITAAIEAGDTEDVVLTRGCDLLALSLNATGVTWEAQYGAVTATSPRQVAVVTTDQPHYVLHVGTLANGRRLLSDDVAMLERAATLIQRRVDALRLTNERYDRLLREREMRSLATEAELRALRAQINPHFLFNALTTIGYLIENAPSRALDTLLRLTTVLRAVLRSEGEFTTLGRELELVDCYLQIERARFEERLGVTIDVPAHLHSIAIPALLIQPLVENAVKHGIAATRDGGTITMTGRVEATSPEPTLCVAVRNTGAPLRTDGRSRTGVGLRSISARLNSHYGRLATLTIGQDASGATVATIRLPVTSHDQAANVASIHAARTS